MTILRLTIKNTPEGIEAEISKREDEGRKLIDAPETFHVGSKAEAKKRASAIARSLGLKTYRVVDRT